MVLRKDPTECTTPTMLPSDAFLCAGCELLRFIWQIVDYLPTNGFSFADDPLQQRLLRGRFLCARPLMTGSTVLGQRKRHAKMVNCTALSTRCQREPVWWRFCTKNRAQLWRGPWKLETRAFRRSRCQTWAGASTSTGVSVAFWMLKEAWSCSGYAHRFNVERVRRDPSQLEDTRSTMTQRSDRIDKATGNVK